MEEWNLQKVKVCSQCKKCRLTPATNAPFCLQNECTIHPTINLKPISAEDLSGRFCRLKASRCAINNPSRATQRRLVIYCQPGSLISLALSLSWKSSPLLRLGSLCPSTNSPVKLTERAQFELSFSLNRDVR